MAIVLTEIADGVAADQPSGGPAHMARDLSGILWVTIDTATGAALANPRLYKSTDNGNNWSLDGTVTSLSCTLSGVCISSSNQIVIYADKNGATDGPHYAIRTGVGTYSAAIRAATEQVASNNPMFCFGPNGTLHAAWSKRDLGGGDPTGEVWYSNDSLGGAPWTFGSESVFAQNLYLGLGLALIIDKNNLAHVLFDNDITDRVNYTNRTGGVWAAPTAIYTGTTLNTGGNNASLSAVLDPIDELTIHTAFYAGINTSRTPHYSVRNPSTGVWTTEQIDAAFITGANTNDISIGLDRSGAIYVIAVKPAQIAVWLRTAPATWVKTIVFAPSYTITSATCFGNGCRNTPKSGTMLLDYGSTGAYFVGELNHTAVGTTDVMFYGIDLSFTVEDESPSCPAEPARASFVFAGEGASEATLTIAPDFVFDGTERYVTLKVPTDRGYVVTHPKFASSRRLYTCRFINRTKADRDALAAFVLARRDGVGAWSLVLPDGGGTVKVHIRTDSLRFSKLNPGVYATEFEVQELFNT